MVKATKRKKNIFDYEADWVPHKRRVLMMKPSKKEEEQEQDQKAPTEEPPPFGLRPLGRKDKTKMQKHHKRHRSFTQTQKA